MKIVLFQLIILSALLTSNIAFGQELEKHKHYISIGFLDHKTGNSLVGYARSLFQNKNNEIYIGGGTLIASNTLLIGFKKYMFRSFVDGYSTFSIQKIYGMGGGLNAAGMSVGIEKKIWKILFLNIGFNAIIDSDAIVNQNLLGFPTLSLNIRF